MNANPETTAARHSPYLWAIPAAFILMLFAFANSYAVFFIDSRSYVRSAAVAADSVLGTGFSDPWRSTVDPRATSATPAPETAAMPVSTTPLVLTAVANLAAEGDAQEAVTNNGITANRSIYYGLVAFLGYATSDFWLLILFQAYVTASCMAIPALRVVGLRPLPYLGITAIVSVVTCIGPFVAYVMPDIFGATIILGAITLLLGWPRLTSFDRLYLSAIVAFSALAHNSNMLLLASVFGGWLLWIIAKRQLKGSLPQAATMVLLLAVGPLGLAAFSYAIERQTGQAPLVLPHITAHLVDLGPGTAYVKEHCREGEFAVCEFRDVLPVTWTEFIGGARDEERGVFAVADLPTKRRLSDEQLAFAAAVFSTYPVETTIGLLGDGAKQLGTLSLVDMKVDPVLQQYLQQHMPPSVWSGISGSTIYRYPGLLDFITYLAYTSSLVGLAYAAWFLYRESRSHFAGSEFLAGSIALLLLAILANAAICGILASPMGRFSARLIWLLPFASLMAAFATWPRLSGPREERSVYEGG